MGSWVTYGLGTENTESSRLCRAVSRAAGARAPALDFHFSARQSTREPTSTTRKKIPTSSPEHSEQELRCREQQRGELDLLGRLNRIHLAQAGADPQLEATIQSVGNRLPHAGRGPGGLRHHEGEREDHAQRYGDTEFGRGCLIARRLAERGVRMVQVYFGNSQPWDNHDDILIHRTLAEQADPAIGALIEGSEERAACCRRRSS